MPISQMRNSFFCAILLFSSLLPEFVDGACKGKFNIYSPTNKEYLVEVQFYTGYELNNRTGSNNYENDKGFAVVFWGPGQATIIKLVYSLVKFDITRQIFDCSIIELWQQMMSNEMMEGYDQQDRRWKISLSNFNQSESQFNKYVPQVPNISNTPDYTGAAAVVGALALGALMDEVFTVSPEERMRRAVAKQQRKQEYLQQKDEREKKRMSRRLVVGSDKYYKCKKSKNLWLGSALLTGAVGTFSYLQANKYMADYPSATTDAASIAQKADIYNSIYPVCYAVAGFCAIEFLFKTIKISKARTKPIGFYTLPVPGGAKLSLTYNF